MHGSKLGPDQYLMSSEEDKLVSLMLARWVMVKQREAIGIVRRTVKKKERVEKYNLMVRGGGLDLYKGILNYLYIYEADALSYCWSNAVDQKSLDY